ncbi:hypothetical protein CO669_33450 [Bradyrhizobium sp. Y36]|uniref:DUF5681 domain-containing protein n=1 Tax=Bradyrhizobium sp. Y36 TaxID=2035447 RepID=UPI000BE813C2|nr:DUF5681 domain-containing protein [Bradyrhizobium sp. Y36]PDT83336.1 hypothetical protein CO669_33450 [Bradyrhizobium sp. Y36]
MDQHSHSDALSALERTSSEYAVGYKRPPRHAQFAKGTSGNPKGRPKRPEGINLKELFDGVQHTKDGIAISRRELIVRRILKDAMAGNPREFKKFLDLLERTGLILRATARNTGPIIVKPVRADVSNP